MRRASCVLRAFGRVVGWQHKVAPVIDLISWFILAATAYNWLATATRRKHKQLASPLLCRRPPSVWSAVARWNGAVRLRRCYSTQVSQGRGRSWGQAESCVSSFYHYKKYINYTWLLISFSTIIIIHIFIIVWIMRLCLLKIVMLMI